MQWFRLLGSREGAFKTPLSLGERNNELPGLSLNSEESFLIVGEGREGGGVDGRGLLRSSSTFLSMQRKSVDMTSLLAKTSKTTTISTNHYR